VTSLGIVLPVDKPEGPTSHDVVAIARKTLGIRRVGHTGTLDPFASGLLLLCIGRATRLAEYLTGLAKSYDAVARLGITTDTEDREGEPGEERPGWSDLTREVVVTAMRGFRGDIDQVPPQFSAKKVDGVVMHRRARRGEHITLAARPITVHELDLRSLDLPLMEFRVRCSSGTYVRSLARDIGEALGVGAHLTGLRRTSIGTHTLERAITPAQFGDPEAVSRAALTPLDALGHLPAVVVDKKSRDRLAFGQTVDAPETAEGGHITVVCDGDLVAIAEVRAGALTPKKVFLP
jgi:tRNA pseudouridine55 synthase